MRPRTPTSIARNVCGTASSAVLSVLLALLCVVATGVSNPASADVFTISHVKVDETAADAAKAKVKAISAAQVIAFRRLVQRLAPAGSLEQLPQFGANEVSRMMSGMTFEDERTGPTRYIATLTIKFLPDNVRELLYQYNVPFAEEQAANILLLPMWKTDKGVALWEGENPWKEAWVAQDLENSLTPLLIPIGDLTDIAALSADEAAASDSIKLEALRLRYGAENVLVSIAERRADGTIYITLKGETSFGLVNYAHSFEIADDDIPATLAPAAERFLLAMEETWKGAIAKINVPSSNLNEITVAIPFDSLAEWNDIRARIQQTYGVGEVQIDSLSARGGIVKVRYEGAIDQFSEELKTNGLILSDVGGTWVIQPYY